MKITSIAPPRVFVIGAGMVGSTIAYALMMRQIAREIVLIDLNQELASGQARDMSHASVFTPGVTVRQGDYSEIRDNDVIVITSGAPQSGDEDRLALAGKNTEIMKDVVSNVMANGRAVFMIIVSNPVDVLTYVAARESGLPEGRVFGSGTALDTARYRFMLSERLGVNAGNIVGFVLGEHGNSSFPALGATTVEGMPLAQYHSFRKEYIEDIRTEVREAAYRIVEEKKATYYGIGSTVAELVDSLVNDRQKILSVSCTLMKGEYGLEPTALGVPAILGGEGARVIEHYPLSEDEKESLHKSNEVIRNTLKNIGY